VYHPVVRWAAKAGDGVPASSVLPFVRLAVHGANIEARDAAGDTPLLIAVRRNDRVLVRHLLDRGADPFVTDASGRSALALAETMKHEDVARVLRRQGAAPMR
jgi:ankyrin repeat protein